jgi:hypothetical protein
MSFWRSLGHSVLGTVTGGAYDGSKAPKAPKDPNAGPTKFHDEAKRTAAGAGTVGFTTSVEGADPNAPKPTAAAPTANARPAKRDPMKDMARRFAASDQGQKLAASNAGQKFAASDAGQKLNQWMAS